MIIYIVLLEVVSIHELMKYSISQMYKKLKFITLRSVLLGGKIRLLSMIAGVSRLFNRKIHVVPSIHDA